MYGSTFSGSQHWLDVSGQIHTLAASSLGKETSGSHWVGGWVDPRASLDDVEK
jgi:hypothetical protein